MDYYSPLRYPGGKGKVANFFKRIIRENNLSDAVYVEPYAGGASVGLALLFNEYVSKIVINDIDRSIYAFWHSVLNKTDKFCELIEKTPLTVKEWKKQRKIHRKKKEHGLFKLGFSTFYLNRTNRSGILNGGVIGGLNQTGKWKIDARYNKERLIERIRKIAQYKNRIEIYNEDAVNLTRTLHKKLSKSALFYFDPPYYIKGKDLYLSFYKNSDHQIIAKEINKLKGKKWVVTYDNVKPIRLLYKKHRKKKFNLNYSAGKASKGEEVMIFSDNLHIPNLEFLKNIKKAHPLFSLS
jgi:DNA adenine methylase